VKVIALYKLLLVVLLSVALPVAAAPPLGRDNMPAWRYTVRPGDTLINIAERHLTDVGYWPAVQKANQVDDPYRLLPGTVLRIPASMLRRVPAAVTVETRNGAVRWRTATGDWQEASEGQRLAAGSTLETLDNASALLRLADGSRLLLSANSQIVFDALGAFAGGLMVDTRLRLQRGQGDITANPARRANQHLQIQTPAAQVVVRGTHFRVGVESDVTREETLFGLVGVSGAGRGVSVPRGRGTIARVGESPIKPVPLLGAPDVSALPTRFEYLPLRFPMPRLPGAAAWIAEVAPDPSFTRIVLSRSGRGDALTFPDLPNGEHVLRLRAIDLNGLQGIDALHRFVVFARPFPPGLNSPGDSATVRSARPPFAWTSQQGVGGYRLQVAAAPDFAMPLHVASTTLNSWEVPADLPPGKLYWRAASVDEQGQQGPWSLAAEFTYKPGPGPVDLGRAAVEFQSEVLRLNLPPAPEGLVYEALLSPDPELREVVAQAQASDGALLLPRPDAGSYYLGIRLLDRSDNTPGPLAVQKIEVPYSRLWLLLLLLPVVAL
jgi:hypothetical protein